MIDLYYFMTPNGLKITICLEEMQLAYKIKLIDIVKGDQHTPEFLAIAPNNRIPAMVDHQPLVGTEPLKLFESGAILEYCADKTDSFLPSANTTERYATLQWLHWQMGGLGPMAGQLHHFNRFAPEQIPYAIQRYSDETRRLYRVLNRQLTANEYVAGDYSIADMACYPWIARHPWQEIALQEFPQVARWYEAISKRPAVQRATALAQQLSEP